ncbi:MAG: response regulator [Acaryochloridaceae cyanobacterium RL_2_7]|nr:response regulator [Acaryochloridaceae cyanobacterium RL_2_7]
MMRFESGQLQQYLLKLEQKKVTGVLTLVVDLPQPDQQRQMLVALRQGHITFAGESLMSPINFVKFIAQELGATFLEPALKVVQPRIQNPASVQEILDLVCRFGLFTWDSVESLMQKQIVMALELVLPYGGGMDFKGNHPFDLSYSSLQQFQLKEILPKIQDRSPVWNSLKKGISGIDTVPRLLTQNQDDIESTEIRDHLNQWVDGNRSLGSIALSLKQDPLELAKRYFQFSRKGWIKFEESAYSSMTSGPLTKPGKSEMPIVLSVDDSPVVQTVIKRSICDKYDVILANNAVDALNMLNSHPVSLLLLDVTMPDIDGLELCRTIRSINKFKDLPVVMLTAKDGLLDKVKGQFAGSTHYLTKPIDREKLLTVLDKYIPQAVIA